MSSQLFTRRAAASLFSNQHIQRWVFDVELVYLADQLGVPITEVFVAWTEMPGSKIRFYSIITMALELLVIKVSHHCVLVMLSSNTIRRGFPGF